MIGLAEEVFFADFETKCRQQGRHCEFPIILEKAIIKMKVVKSKNKELRNELIRNDGDLKSVRETVKSFEIARQGHQPHDPGGEQASQAAGGGARS